MSLVRREANGQEIPKLLNQGWLVVSSGRQGFTKDHADWIHYGGRGEIYTMSDLTKSEDMFLRDEVSTEESFKVGGIPLNVEYSNVRKNISTTTKVGLYEINNSMYEWATNIGERLRETPIAERPLSRNQVLAIYSKDREWVNDDTLLIAMCMRDTYDMSYISSVCLFSRDKRLANQMCQQCNVHVLLVDPIDLIWKWPDKVWNSSTVITGEEANVFLSGDLKRRLKFFVKAYLDTGSVMSVLSTIERSYNKTNPVFTRRVLQHTGFDKIKQCRYSSYTSEIIGWHENSYSVRHYDPTKKNNYHKIYNNLYRYSNRSSDELSWRSGPSTYSNSGSVGRESLTLS